LMEYRDSKDEDVSTGYDTGSAFPICTICSIAAPYKTSPFPMFQGKGYK